MPPSSLRIAAIKKNRSYTVEVTLLPQEFVMSVLSRAQWQQIKATWSLYVPVRCDWCKEMIPAEQAQCVAIHDVRKHLISGDETVCRECVCRYIDKHEAVEA
jgi:hypothetical protein